MKCHKCENEATYSRKYSGEDLCSDCFSISIMRKTAKTISKYRMIKNGDLVCVAVLGTKVGSTIQFGLKSEIESSNVISIQNIPDGTIICNVEKHFGDGGTIVKSAGSNATVFSHGEDGVTLKLPSGKFVTLNPKNRAMIGTLAGGGVTERPLMSAGAKWRRFRSKGRKYPIVRGVAQAAYVHPHGGGRHQHVGQSSTVSRNAPPGAKVGSIAARKTGRARIKERK